MEQQDIKLTKMQNCVVWCLQNGWCLITDKNMTGALVASRLHTYKINNGLFWRLAGMDIIYQRGTEHHHDFHLTPLGLRLKTKPVNGFDAADSEIVEQLRKERK